MQILMQLAVIFFVCWLGECISAMLPFAFPASVISMILVFLVLLSGRLKVYQIKKHTDFLLDNMAFFFIPPAVSIMDNLHYMEGKLLIFLFICFVSILTTFAITAYTVAAVIRLQERWKERQLHE